jgi:hypothetical protein
LNRAREEQIRGGGEEDESDDIRRRILHLFFKSIFGNALSSYLLRRACMRNRAQKKRDTISRFLFVCDLI